MSQYIRFTTEHNQRTFGNPVHDGARLKRFHDVSGIVVNDELQMFQDETIPERVGHYLIHAKKLRRKRIAVDCVAFVTLMESIELKDRTHNPFSNFDESHAVEGAETSTATGPLILAQGFHDGVRIPRHVVLPAHLTNSEKYIHKLGDDGPLCMSDLRDAMAIMSCNAAYRVISQ